MSETFWGIMLPFFGTSLGASCVFFMRGSLNEKVSSSLSGFSAGIMIAASVWSLLIPSIERAVELGFIPFLPASIGFFLGMTCLFLIDKLCDKEKITLGKNGMMIFAVVVHNIPEGLAVGIIYAIWLSGTSGVSLAAAFSLALGIAIQNFPEGAIISMPLCAGGMSAKRAFFAGVISGIVEPVSAALAIVFLGKIVPIMPFLLSFAAGAMIYVSVTELLCEISGEKRSAFGLFAFTFGFIIMMSLDVALG